MELPKYPDIYYEVVAEIKEYADKNNIPFKQVEEEIMWWLDSLGRLTILDAWKAGKIWTVIAIFHKYFGGEEIR